MVRIHYQRVSVPVTHHHIRASLWVRFRRRVPLVLAGLFLHLFLVVLHFQWAQMVQPVPLVQLALGHQSHQANRLHLEDHDPPTGLCCQRGLQHFNRVLLYPVPCLYYVVLIAMQCK